MIKPFSNNIITYEELVDFSMVTANTANNIYNELSRKAGSSMKSASPSMYSYTIQESDVGGLVICNDIRTITVPSDASANIPEGTMITVVSRSSNVDILPEGTNAPKITAAGFGKFSNWIITENTIIQMVKVEPNDWIVSGFGIEEQQ